MRDRIRRLVRRDGGASVAVFPDPWPVGPVLAVAHPDWRGVRTAARSFGDPTVEVRDAAASAAGIVGTALDRGVRVVVVHGYPPGAGDLLRAAREAGLGTRAVVHSSTAQHGGDAHEAAVIDEVAALAGAGVVERIGFVKAGHAEAFRALGLPAAYTPNRAPDMSGIEPTRPDGPGPHVGVFAEPFWRKNVATQLAAVAMIGGATAHVMRRPSIAYLDPVPIVEHGELPWQEFAAVQAGMDINLSVTLSECHPMSPVESVLSGVPCLISRVSGLFADDPELLEWASVDRLDDPGAIARAAERMMENPAPMLHRAADWIRAADADAAERWAAFTAV